MSTEPATGVNTPTERRSPQTLNIDVVPTIEAVGLIIDEEAMVAPAVRRIVPQLATVVDEAAARLHAGGNIHYFGAGTSGRIGLLDAVEIHCTYGIGTGRVIAHHASGDAAFTEEAPDFEDDKALGRRDAAQVTDLDIVVGLTASGSTPYVRGAIERAKESRAYTVLMTSVPGSPIGAIVDSDIVLRTGAEAVTGSTRMKAGTALKMTLNAFSTTTMIRLNRTYSNLMVAGIPSNEKGEGRKALIFAEATGLDKGRSSDALEVAEGSMRAALVMQLGSVDLETARALLEKTAGSVRLAVGLAGTAVRGQPA